MPKAEVGTTKYLNNKLKSKGLQRLRWYCQVCEKQCRDENGFKCHVASESHTRQMQVIGETGASKVINDYSHQFQRDFVQLLRTSHNTKAVNLNHFYQQYISNKEHVHMNATRWPSLTEFGKYLGREGICRVEEDEKNGLQVSWIDNSPEALRRQEAIRRKERQDKGDEEREQKMIKQQIERAEIDAEAKARKEEDEEARELRRIEGERITLNFAVKAKENENRSYPAVIETEVIDQLGNPEKDGSNSASPLAGVPTLPLEKVSLRMGINNKPKNVFAGHSKKAAFGGKAISRESPEKPMSEAERIMKEEIERKRKKEADGGPMLNLKRIKLM